MQHKITVKVPASTREVTTSVTCDLCGVEIKEENYEIDSVKLAYKSGSNYPEGGSGTEISVDMCGACFEGKLVPWLRSQGVEPRTEEWEHG